MIFKKKDTNMEINELKQAKNLLMSKEKILLVTHQKMDADGLSSMLALGVFLERLGKQVKIISTDPVPENFTFLPFTDRVLISSNAVKDFVISIKTLGTDIDKLRYNVEGDKLNIIISPKSGDLKEENVSFNKGIGKFDLIIAVDTGDLEYLGSIYTDNIEMFYETPVVNIDHHITNTAFGQINLVDITASSSTMIIFDLMKEFSENWNEMIDEDVATLLMAGLITDTGSFQHGNTSPRSLDLAADLMDFGARQQEIIKNIYKTKHLSTLQIWGKILSKIQEDPIFRIVWSTVTKEDLIETGADLEEANLLIDELMTNAPGAEVIFLIKESLDGDIFVSLRSTSITVDVSTIAKNFLGGGHKQAAGFKISKYSNFELEVGKIISYIQDFQKKRLGISDEEILELQISSKENKKEVKKLGTISNFIDIQKEKQNHMKDTGITFPLSKNDKKEKGNDNLPFSVENNFKEKEVKKPLLFEEKKEEIKAKIEPKKEKQTENFNFGKSEKIKTETKKQVFEEKKEIKKPEIKIEKIEKKEVQNNKNIFSTPKKEEKINIIKKENLSQNPVKKEQKQEIKNTGNNGLNSTIQPKKINKIEPKKVDKKPEIQAKKIEPKKINISEKSEEKKSEVFNFSKKENEKTKISQKIEAKKQPEIQKKSSENQVKTQNNSQKKEEKEESGIVGKEQADGYARRFYELLKQTKQDTVEYKKYYEGYMYYAKLAGWDI